MIVPLVFAAGIATDLGRAVAVRTQLQRAADSAALAGATVYTSSATASAATVAATDYMNAAISAMRDSASATFTVALSTKVASTTTTDYIVTVSSNATMNTTLMKLVESLVTVGATAVADNPVYSLTIALNSFSSGAYDADSIYYYVVPSDGGAPSTTTKLFSNTSSNSTSSIIVTLTAGQSVGFMLKNVTGGITGYGSNGYGAAQGSTHLFYSHMSPPGKIAYPSITSNCALQVATSLTKVTSGSCLSATPALGSFNCSAAGTSPYYFAWNDMGGNPDDKDFNDAVFKVACSNTGSSVNGVVLLQ